MGSQACDGCGERVSIGGGISAIWSFSPDPTGGMTLEFEDGSEHFLCFACIEQIPDYPTAEDVDALSENSA